MKARMIALLAGLAAALWLPAAASAQPAAQMQQTACAAGDLPCRIAELEAENAALRAQLAERTESAETAIAQLADVTRPTLDVIRRCANNCADEAEAVCRRQGYAGGEPEEWRRQRGSVTLTRAVCTR
jgi:hypothetical protein